MNKFEKAGLSKEDLAHISEYVDTFCCDEDQDDIHLRIPIETYLEQWHEQKSKFLLSMFNNQLIHKSKVSYEKPSSKIYDDVYGTLFRGYRTEGDFNEEVIRPIIVMMEKVLLDGQVSDWPYRAMWSRDEVEIRVWNEQWGEQADYIRAINRAISDCDSYVENACDYNINLNRKDVVPHPASCSRGQKPFKLINQLIKCYRPYVQKKDPSKYNDEFFDTLSRNIEKWRIKHSQILNVTTLKGNLCLSIHPLDYITASDNDCDWDSCMTWTREDCPGEYRLGTVEMMNSPIVVVAYLESSTPYYPVSRDWAWNNKKWRGFYIVDRNVITSIRSYPYQAPDLEEQVVKELAAMAEAAGYPSYQGESQVGRTTMLGDKKLLFNTNAMYNDTEYHPRRARASSEPDFDILERNEDIYLLNYSGPTVCCECGKIFVRTIDEAEKLNCEDCEGGLRCACCHSIIEDDDNAIIIDGKYYCDECVVFDPIAKAPLLWQNGKNPDCHTIMFHCTEKDRQGNTCNFEWAFYVNNETLEKLKPTLVVVHGTKDNPAIVNGLKYYYEVYFVTPQTPEKYIKMLTTDPHYAQYYYDSYTYTPREIFPEPPRKNS